MNMVDNSNTDLTPEEHNALLSARTEYAPPVDLETRIRQEMRRRRLLAGTPVWRNWRVAAGLVALAVTFTLGLQWKHLLAPAQATQAIDSRPHFMLLLYEDAGVWKGKAEDHAALVKEYGDWARSLASNGSLISADELSKTGVTLTAANLQGAGAEDRSPADGYFMVAARDESEALQIAKTCPHLRHGGRVVVQKVLI